MPTECVVVGPRPKGHDNSWVKTKLSVKNAVGYPLEEQSEILIHNIEQKTKIGESQEGAKDVAIP